AGHPPAVELTAHGPLMLGALSSEAGLEVREVYERHADFVWRSLQHLGVRSADLEDLGQEVFVVVHRRLSTFDGRSKLTTWLFGICLNLVQRHRRRAYFRLEFLHAEPPERIDADTPEARYAGEQTRRKLEHLLGKLSPERRATFVMFEVEGMSCEEIAELTAVPVGTVYSRLHLARKQVKEAAARLRRSGQWEEA
ncbi:MAG TPA: sigma-70 family RNA polymerase sigma factor, partial [Polyangiaceae bacterium]|nr:sigma-70 family RNA polymerase sigma factor [Polyangiaceae bacterium]